MGAMTTYILVICSIYDSGITASEHLICFLLSAEEAYFNTNGAINIVTLLELTLCFCLHFTCDQNDP